jgi:exopolyphosphatase/pppGpp-phosphohydrolase
MSDQRLAGIDIGTLTCRLLIADLPTTGPLKALHAERRILRLGEGVDQSKRLKSEAMDRVAHCLQEWQRVIDGFHVQRRTAVATSAVRDAQNRQEFLDRLRSETGIDVEILTGEEEANRTMLGIRSGLPPEVGNVLALDIGGGDRLISASSGCWNVCCTMILRLKKRSRRRVPGSGGKQERCWPQCREGQASHASVLPERSPH